MNAAPFPAPRRWLRAAARLIQFRSELAIGVALAAGVAAGAVARHVLPVSKSQAATFDAALDRREPASQHPSQHRQRTSRPAGARPADPQAVDLR